MWTTPVLCINVGYLNYYLYSQPINKGLHMQIPGCPSPTDSEVKRNVLLLELAFILMVGAACKQVRRSKKRKD